MPFSPQAQLWGQESILLLYGVLDLSGERPIVHSAGWLILVTSQGAKAPEHFCVHMCLHLKRARVLLETGSISLGIVPLPWNLGHTSTWLVHLYEAHVFDTEERNFQNAEPFS